MSNRVDVLLGATDTAVIEVDDSLGVGEYDRSLIDPGERAADGNDNVVWGHDPAECVDLANDLPLGHAARIISVCTRTGGIDPR